MNYEKESLVNFILHYIDELNDLNRRLKKAEKIALEKENDSKKLQKLLEILQETSLKIDEINYE